MNMTSIHEDVGLIPGLAQWFRDLAFPWVVSVGCRCGSDLALLWLWCRPADLSSSLGTSICCRCGPKKKKNYFIPLSLIYVINLCFPVEPVRNRLQDLIINITCNIRYVPTAYRVPGIFLGIWGICVSKTSRYLWPWGPLNNSLGSVHLHCFCGKR